MKICNKITVMHQGCDLVTGTPAEVRNNPQVLDAYLGGSDDEFDQAVASG